MQTNDVRFAQRIARGTVFALNCAIQYLWLTLLGVFVGAAHALQAAAGAAAGLAVNTGASPAGVLSGQAPQAALVIHYNNKFTQNLKGKTPAQRVCSRREMPLNAGQQYRDHMYNQIAPISTVAQDGTVGSSLTCSVAYQTFTIGQWANYVNFSDFVLSTTIDPMVENVERELAYSLARVIQALTLAQLDTGRTVDARVGALDATSATQSMTRNTTTQASGSLRGIDVQPLEGMARFGGLIHPNFTTDMMIDNSNNSYSDILKHTAEGQLALKELPTPVGGEEADVISFAGVTWLESTQLTKTPNWTPPGGTATTSTAIRTYVVGQDGILAIRLDRPERTSINDGRLQNLKLWRGKYAMGTSFDPAGQIGGGTSYNVTGTWGLPPDTTLRYRAFDFVPQHT